MVDFVNIISYICIKLKYGKENRINTGTNTRMFKII